jgi:modification target Cys-rich repeat protein
MKNLLGVISCVVLLAAGCTGPGGSVPGFCSLDFSRPVTANFGNADLDALLEASARFNVAAHGIDTDVRAACNGIATDLGGASSTDTQTACDNAVAEINRIKAANSTVTLAVTYTPGVCSVSASAVVDCVASCDVTFDATVTPPTCTGGELSGTCSGTCSGSCTVEGSVSCTGACTGSCQGACDAEVSGSCAGTCTGQCEGTCATTNADGSCAGACTGTCRGACTGTLTGECSGSCDGTCTGSCRSDLVASCSGQCSGSCDVALTAPRCEGGQWDVAADADCQAACEADASFELVCTDPSLVATFAGSATTRADVEALLATLEANLPRLLAAAAKAEIIVSASTDFATHLEAATSAATSAGLEASSCLVNAIAAQVEAASMVNVSVQVSVSVSASASASAG